jgi:hypothetical protein
VFAVFVYFVFLDFRPDERWLDQKRWGASIGGARYLVAGHGDRCRDEEEKTASRVFHWMQSWQLQ